MTLLFRDADKHVELRSSREGPIAFGHHSEAAHYLRKSSNRPAVIAVLRKVLSEHHHVQVWRLSDDAVIDEVARRLVNGSLQLLEMLETRAEVRSERKAETAEQAGPPIEASQAQVQEPLPAPGAETAPAEMAAEELLDLQAETEVESQPELAAGVEAEEPPAIQIEAEVEEAPAPAVETQIETPPVLTTAAEVAQQAALGVEAQAASPPALATEAEAALPPKVDVGAQPEATPALAAEAEAEEPQTLATEAEAARPPARPALEVGAQDDKPDATKPKD